jgi:anti-anti-sigma factor
MTVTYSIDMEEDTGTARFRGELTSEHADNFRLALARSLGSGRRLISLDLQDVARIDLSCLKLICAAHRSTSRKNRKLQLVGVRPDVFRKTVREAGYCRHIGCGPDHETECLWTGI